MMVIDEIDYDSTMLEGQRNIFSQVANNNDVVQTVHTLEKPRHDLFNKEEDVVTSSKNYENRKRAEAKAKKHAMTFIVGKDISLT